jgi:hypothetical protein
MPGPAERVRVQLEHRDPAAVDALAQCRGPTRVQLHCEDATTRAGETDGQCAVTCAEVDDDVSGPDG